MSKINKQSDPSIFLICRLSIFKFLLIAIKSAINSKFYYYDLSSTNNALDIQLAIRVFGVGRVQDNLNRIFKYFNLNINTIPNRNSIKEYPNIYLKAHKTLLKLISITDFTKVKKIKKIHVLTNSLKEVEAQESINKKLDSELMWPIIENIQILTQTNQGNINLIGFPNHINQEVRSALSFELLNVSITNNSKNYSIILIVITIVSLLTGIFRHTLSYIRNNPINKNEYKIVTEFISLTSFEKKPGDSNYFENDINLKNKILYYISLDQEKWLSVSERKELANLDVIRFKNLKYESKYFLNELKLKISLLIRCINGNTNLLHLKYQLMDIEFYCGLKSLLNKMPVEHHLSYIFPNGKTSIRNNGGIVTDICHSVGAKNVGLQTRTYYGDHFHYNFNYEDVRLTWCKVWDEPFKKNNFINHYEEIGNIYSKKTYHKPKLNPRIENIVIFLADIETGFATSMYNLTYTIIFLRKVFAALENNATKSPKNYNI